MPKKISLKALQIMPPNEAIRLETPIAWLFQDGQFGTRTYRALETLNCKNTYDILSLDPALVHSIPSIGARTVAEVMAFMLRYRSLLDATNISLKNPELTPFDVAKKIVNAGLRSHHNDFLAMSKDLPSSVRVIIDFKPNEEPHFGFEPVKDDALTLPLTTLVSTDNVTDNEEFEDAPIVKKKRKVLEIVSPDGEVWSEEFAYLTFMKFIEKVGIEKVAALNIEAKPGIPLVSKQKHDNTSSKASTNGWYIFTGIANTIKAQIVKKISQQLNLEYVAHNYTKILD